MTEEEKEKEKREKKKKKKKKTTATYPPFDLFPCIKSLFSLILVSFLFIGWLRDKSRFATG